MPRSEAFVFMVLNPLCSDMPIDWQVRGRALGPATPTLRILHESAANPPLCVRVRPRGREQSYRTKQARTRLHQQAHTRAALTGACVRPCSPGNPGSYCRR
eukprot:71577-Prorocentrum_minimum.AAC.1